MAHKTKDAEPELDLSRRLKKVDAVPPQPASGSKKQHHFLTIPELAHYAPAARFLKEIEALMDGMIGTPIREALYAYVIEQAPLGKMPDNPKGVDGNGVAQASLQMRQRSSRSPLKEDEVTRLAAFDIPVFAKVRAPHTMRLKPELYGDKKLVNRIFAALDKADLDWTDLFEEQNADIDMIVDDATVATLFTQVKKAKEVGSNSFTPEVLRELLEIVFQRPSIRTEQYYGDLTDALKIVRRHICPTAQDIKEMAAEEAALARQTANREAKSASTKPTASAKPPTKPVKPDFDDSTVLSTGIFSHTGKDARRLQERERAKRR